MCAMLAIETWFFTGYIYVLYEVHARQRDVRMNQVAYIAYGKLRVLENM